MLFTIFSPQSGSPSAGQIVYLFAPPDTEASSLSRSEPKKTNQLHPRYNRGFLIFLSFLPAGRQAESAKKPFGMTE